MASTTEQAFSAKILTILSKQDKKFFCLTSCCDHALKMYTADPLILVCLLNNDFALEAIFHRHTSAMKWLDLHDRLVALKANEMDPSFISVADLLPPNLKIQDSVATNATTFVPSSLTDSLFDGKIITATTTYFLWCEDFDDNDYGNATTSSTISCNKNDLRLSDMLYVRAMFSSPNKAIAYYNNTCCDHKQY